MSENPNLYTLKKQDKYSERLKDGHKLFLRLSVGCGLGFFTAGILLEFLSDFLSILALPLIGGGLLIGLNHLVYLKVKKLQISAYMLTGLVWILSIAITFVSNALNSPFLSVLLLVVFVTIATFRPLAYWVLAASTLAYSLFYLNAFPELSALNEHLTSTDGSLLYLIGISFSSALLIYVIGQYLYTLHRRLYTEKAEVEKRLNEKEILLKEVHHRVKNNLQTVSSLLRMQGRNIEAGESLNLIQSSQNRVVAMAMVHEMLYMREDLAKIDYRTYVSELGGYLIKSIKGPESKITLRIDIPEIELGIDTAIPLGLLINEAVTNALKYGFRDRETGEISILLERENKTEFVLRIGDNGIGYPESVSYKTTKSLGLKLIHNLSRQLQGTVIRDLSKEGTNYIIRFHELNPSSFHSLA